MREEGMDSGLCDLVAAGHNKTSDITINGKSLHAEMKRILSTSNKGTEEYKKMVRASTKIYRDNWWEAILWGIYNSGVKSKLGMGVIARWMGLTGGFKNLCKKSLRAGLFYNNISNADEVVKLEPAVAGQDKEKDWIIAYNKNYSKAWGAWTKCANDFINAANTGNLDSPEFNAAAQGVVIRYGEIISSLAVEEQDIIEILKTANGPEVLGNGITELGEGVTGITNRAENIVKYMTDYKIQYGHSNRANFINNSNFGKQVQSNGLSYIEPRLKLNSKETDCSGFVSWVLLDLEIIKEPISSQAFIDNSAKLSPQYKAVNITNEISSGRMQIQAGDILVRKTPPGKPMGHIGISLGGNMQLDWGATHWWNKSAKGLPSGGDPNPRKAYHLGSGGSAPYYDHVFRIMLVKSSTT